MNFDATVTLGNVVAAGVALTAVFSALVFYFGQRFFPTKPELDAIQKHVDEKIQHVDEQLVAVRTDVETAVRGMENLITKEIRNLTDISKERHDRQCGDFIRLETAVTTALGDVREARDTAREARAESANTKETMNAGIHRIEQAVERLANRPRRTDP